MVGDDVERDPLFLQEGEEVRVGRVVPEARAAIVETNCCSSSPSIKAAVACGITNTYTPSRVKTDLKVSLQNTKGSCSLKAARTGCGCC